ncbi:MAG: bile acid:sodium symporter family protein, partial [Bacteroidaceae bacterium]|nr:bile acid:sodium symporter family protein [Bacteroidaceae bacterium]
MYHILKTISDTLSDKASIFIILTAVVTFFSPTLFEWVKGNTQTIILGIIMLTMGLTLTPDDFRLLAKRPVDILIGAAAQFTIMPLVAFSLAWLFSQVPAFAPYSTAMAIGIILVGCCPGGVSSNIMSFLCKGDVAYSVGMTCASTLLAPVLTPLLVLWLAGERVDVDAIGMFQQILIVTIIPIAIGFFLNVWLGHKAVFQKIQSCMPGL